MIPNLTLSFVGNHDSIDAVLPIIALGSGMQDDYKYNFHMRLIANLYAALCWALGGQCRTN